MATISTIIFIQDLTGDFTDDLDNSKVIITAVIKRLTNPF